MKKSLLKIVAAAVAFSVWTTTYAPAAPKVGAAPVNEKQQQQQQQKAEVQDPKSAEHLKALQQAYNTLQIADHDYDGHRVKAMHAIEKACDMLGSDIRGGGKGKERQPISDAQLRDAQKMVEGVKNDIPKGKEKKFVGHLNEANKEITAALKIK